MGLKKQIAGLNILGMKGSQWGVLLLIGILLMVIALPVKKSEEIAQSTTPFDTDESKEYVKNDLEYRLEELLSNVEGVGKVQVMLMLQEESGDMFSDHPGIKVTGALISAQGAENMVVVQNIKQAVVALFQLEAHKIKVMKMNEGESL